MGCTVVPGGGEAVQVAEVEEAVDLLHRIGWRCYCSCLCSSGDALSRSSR